MKKALGSIGYMFLVAVVFTAVVSVVKLGNDARIERNQMVKLQKIVLMVLTLSEPGASDEDLLRTFGERVKAITVKDQTVYVGYEADGRTVLGYAFPVGGPGFWGPIYGMVGVNPDASKILGVAFYKHSETPGLGGRISEDWFMKQFAGLPLFPVEGDKKIFYLKPEGARTAPNDLDAITGASNTSAAVEAFLNRDLDQFLKQLWREIKKG